ncbi:hypothetical protein SNE40_011514 [Patella caerulea]|uniref:GH10 domain-containing protein n=1 Tax=Patella caerulea TaxID=87958 RepID=A0AAN8JQ24_PATCE
MQNRLKSLNWVILLLGYVQSQNIFKDGDFEASNPHQYWQCDGGCTMTSVNNDKVNGSRAIKVTDRHHYYQGPGQSVELKRNARYHVIWYVKQLNSIPGKLFQEFRVTCSFRVNDNLVFYPDFVRDHKVHPGRGWVKLEGYMKTPDRDFISGGLKIQMADPGIEFLADTATLTFIPEETNWKENANKRIEKYRKSNVSFTFNIPPNTDPHEYDLEESPDYGNSDKALDVLQQNGIPVRGHNIFWGVDRFVPKWVLPLSQVELEKEIEHRIHYVLNVTKGKLESWDVNNEMLHGHFYENKMNDPYYSHKIYKLVHQIDPTVKLFLNDYQIVANGTSVSSYVDQAREFKKASIPIYALGVQSHFDDYREPDPTMTLKRLDQLAVTGLPIWITEMDVVAADENVRRDWYETLYRVYFSHPSVEAIILWGFWGPKHWIGEEASLVSGSDYTINAAGRGYLDLVFKEWNTHVTRRLSSGKQFIVRGFHGDYEITIKYKGVPVVFQKFSLGKQDKQVTIDVTDIHAQVIIPTTSSPLIFHRPAVHHKIVTHETYYQGRATSGDSSTMNCVNKWSAFAVMKDDQHVDVKCPQDYVLTGCSSLTKALTAKGDGTSVDTQNGVICRAWNGGGPENYNSPVHAFARCCKVTGLKCEYRATPKPSPSEFDVIVETKCPNNMYATGCAAHNWNRHMDGIYPTTHSCLAQNQDDFGGTWSYSICCNAPNMHCQVKKSTSESGHKIGDSSVVSCSNGWTMTGCHGVSEDGDISGSFIEGDKCIAFNGNMKTPGMAGSVAYATCCKTM